MCDKCRQLDHQIARYHEFMAKVPDTEFAKGLAKLIAEAEAEKAALHPERVNKSGP
jgi:hypothetical protein